MTTQSETKGERSLYFNLSLFLYFISWAMLPCFSWTPLLVTDKSQWYQCSRVTVYIPFRLFTRGFKRLRLWSKSPTWVIKKKSRRHHSGYYSYFIYKWQLLHSWVQHLALSYLFMCYLSPFYPPVLIANFLKRCSNFSFSAFCPFEVFLTTVCYTIAPL